jgi:hypothetical protein
MLQWKHESNRAAECGYNVQTKRNVNEINNIKSVKNRIFILFCMGNRLRLPFLLSKNLSVFI